MPYCFGENRPILLVEALPQAPPLSCEPAANTFFEQGSQDGSTVMVHEQEVCMSHVLADTRYLTTVVGMRMT